MNTTLRRLVVLGILASPLLAPAAEAQPARRDTVWVETSPGMRRSFEARSPRLVDLDRAALARVAGRTGRIGKTMVVSLPLPSGGFVRVRLRETAMLEATLAERFPNLRSFRVEALGNKSVSGALAITPAGVHALVFTRDGAFFVVPEHYGNSTRHISLDARTARRAVESSECSAGLERVVDPQVDPPSLLPVVRTRTYRIAMATTGEYAEQFRLAPADTEAELKPRTLGAVFAMMTMVNAIFERDLAVSFVIAGDTYNVLFTNPDTDPYVNGNTNLMRQFNQYTLDDPANVGAADYDIGHVFGTNSGGQGFPIGQVCTPQQKAQGATGQALPNNPEDVLLVAHEMGHQFGADHSFNGTAPLLDGTPDCGPSRVEDSAYEAGAGSTIMSYAGGCGTQALQPNRDAHFHARNILQIKQYLGEAGTCAPLVEAANIAPFVYAGPDVTIPARVPFKLTATGWDFNGDPITYSWEEYDLGAPSPPDTDTDGNARPILRGYAPTSSPARTFPSETYLINNGGVPPQTYKVGNKEYLVAEALPTISRTMTFRVMARDGRGGVWWDDALVHVVKTPEPFAVSPLPPGQLGWFAGSLQDVGWEVGGTNEPPFNVEQVRILLSVDGGRSFPFVLARTENDGRHVIRVPRLSTGRARVKIDAVGSVFFAVSAEDFSIGPRLTER